MKLNYMKMKGGLFVWKQIETENGVTFMRLKRRYPVQVSGDC